MKKSRRNEARRGFSLVELLVVSLIIVMLAGTVSVTVFTMLHKAQGRRIRVDMKAIQNAVNYYRLNEQSAPQSVEDLIEKGYLDEEPKDPWGNLYRISAWEEDKVQVISLGADGIDGGTGNDEDRDSWDLEFMEGR